MALCVGSIIRYPTFDVDFVMQISDLAQIQICTVTEQAHVILTIADLHSRTCLNLGQSNLYYIRFFTM